MNIAIVGYGKMGHEIESLIRARTEHQITAIACTDEHDTLRIDQLEGAEVAIDFSHGSLMNDHMQVYIDTQTPVVIGTTGWDNESKDMIDRISQAGIGVVVGSNFSAGLQVYLHILRVAAKRLHAIGGYDVYGHEIHHAAKADSPSGTAKTISNTLLEHYPEKHSVEYDRIEGRIQPEVLHFASMRGGVHAGKHEVVFDSNEDSITVAHSAHNRAGFADGAIKAAEYIVNHSGYVRFESLFEKGGPYDVSI